VSGLRLRSILNRNLRARFLRLHIVKIRILSLLLIVALSGLFVALPHSISPVAACKFVTCFCSPSPQPVGPAEKISPSCGGGGSSPIPWNTNAVVACPPASTSCPKSFEGPPMVYDQATQTWWLIVPSGTILITTGLQSSWGPTVDTGISASPRYQIDAVYALGSVYMIFRTDQYSCAALSSDCSGTVYIRIMSCTSPSSCTGPVTLFSQTWTNLLGPFLPTLCPCSITYDAPRNRFVFALFNTACCSEMEIRTGSVNQGVWSFGVIGVVSSSSGVETASGAGQQIRYLAQLGKYYLAWAGGDSHINVLQSYDAVTWTNKVTLSETTASTPTIGYNPIEGLFHIAWQGTDSSNLLNDESSPDTATWTNKVTFSLSSGGSPSLAYDSSLGILFLGFAWNQAGEYWSSVVWQQ
jgi:hypothetical protein